MSASDFPVVDSYLDAPPARSGDEALDQAMLRAYPIERAVDYGCALEDALKLRRRVEAGHGWADIALLLAGDNERRAAFATAMGRGASASRYLLGAAACCRLAQAGLEHDAHGRLQAYMRQAGAFRSAMLRPVGDLPPECIEIRYREVAHAAWLFRAPGMSAGGAAVVVWGGADGWCEAFHAGVPAYLEKGLSVCLLELPGQGLARLAGGSRLRIDFTCAVSAALDVLVARGASMHRLGVVGHSVGGALALAAAASDERIRACCSNGGSAELKLGLAKYPRVLQRFGRMLGDDGSGADALEFLDALELDRCTRTMRASLLCLHGGRDAIVSDAEAHRLVELRGNRAATLAYWPEGAHCLYDHRTERNDVLTSWLSHQLADGTPDSTLPLENHPCIPFQA